MIVVRRLILRLADFLLATVALAFFMWAGVGVLHEDVARFPDLSLPTCLLVAANLLCVLRVVVQYARAVLAESSDTAGA